MLDIRKSNLFLLEVKSQKTDTKKKKRRRKSNCLQKSRNHNISLCVCALDVEALAPHIPWAGEGRSTVAWLHNRVKSEADAAAGNHELEQRYELSHARPWCRTAGWCMANAGLGIQVQINEEGSVPLLHRMLLHLHGMRGTDSNEQVTHDGRSDRSVHI